jgi:modulator of FtsH protease
MLKTSYKQFLKKINEKKFFMMEVYLLLIFQIIIAFSILHLENKINLIDSRYKFYGIVILLFLIIFIMHHLTDKILKFIFLVLFSCCLGFLLGYKIDGKTKDGKELEKKSFLTTIVIFIYMIFFTFFLSSIGLKIPPYTGIALFFGLLIVIVLIFISSVSNTYPLYQKIFSGILIFLFSGYIIYDTDNILNRDYDGNDFISATLDYLLDFINVFSDVLDLES